MYKSVNAYKETKIKTANPSQLIILLYEGAIKELGFAINELEENTKSLDLVHNAIVKTQNIVLELTASLDHSQGGNISRDLERLYLYMNQRLTEANIKKDPTILIEVKDLLKELYSAWVQIIN